MRIDIFCDCGESIGLGHIKRCENLILQIQALFSFMHFKITFHSYPFALPSYPLDLVVIDSYLADLEFYDLLMQNAQILLVLDDTHRLAYPPKSFILRPTFGATAYTSQCYAGSEYIILHPAFLAPSHTQESPKHILITLGGSQQNALILEILNALPPSYTPIILNPFFTHPHYQTFCNLSAKQVCSLIDSCEFVITAGGGSLNEAFMRQKKIIALCLAPNQKPQLSSYPTLPSLAKFFSLQEFKNALPTLLASLTPASTPPLIGSKLPLMLTHLIHSLIASKIPHLKPFCTLLESQKLQVLALRNQQEVREASFDSKIISPKEHFEFISSMQPHQLYFAYLQDSQIIGVIGVIPTSNQEATISLYKDLHLPKVGDLLLECILECARLLNLKVLNLKVLKNNTRAICFYQKHHFFITKQDCHSLSMQRNLLQ